MAHAAQEVRLQSGESVEIIRAPAGAGKDLRVADQPPKLCRRDLHQAPIPRRECPLGTRPDAQPVIGKGRPQAHLEILPGPCGWRVVVGGHPPAIPAGPCRRRCRGILFRRHLASAVPDGAADLAVIVDQRGAIQAQRVADCLEPGVHDERKVHVGRDLLERVGQRSELLLPAVEQARQSVVRAGELLQRAARSFGDPDRQVAGRDRPQGQAEGLGAPAQQPTIGRGQDGRADQGRDHDEQEQEADPRGQGGDGAVRGDDGQVPGG